MKRPSIAEDHDTDGAEGGNGTLTGGGIPMDFESSVFVSFPTNGKYSMIGTIMGDLETGMQNKLLKWIFAL
jgi:hypothetical protein